MAKWRIEPTGDGRWWLMSGTNTLGKLNGERTARLVVRDHNDLEEAREHMMADAFRPLSVAKQDGAHRG